MANAATIIERIIALQEDPEIDTSSGPAFQCYPEKWLGDVLVTLMSFAARGVHFHLLMLAWKGFTLDGEPIPCSIPADPEVLRAICQRPEDWDEIWPEVARAWKEHDGRLWNTGLCRTYLAQMDHRRRRTRAGKKGAKGRWPDQKTRTDQTAQGTGDRTSNGRSKNALPQVNPASTTEDRDASAKSQTCESETPEATDSSESHNSRMANASDSHALATDTNGSNDAIATPETSPMSFPVSMSLSVDKKKKAPNSSKKDSKALEAAGDVGALEIPKSDRRQLAQLLVNPELIEPTRHRAAKVTDEKAARTERIHLLAHLAQSTSSAIQARIDQGLSEDSALDLWHLWRQQRKAKVKAERRPWFSEVQTLRKLLDGDHSPTEVIDALIAAGTAGWQGFEWSWVEGKGKQAAGTGNAAPTGAAGFLPPEDDGIDI